MTDTTSRVSKSGALKLGFAALATAALTIGGLTPAYAADVQLGPADIAGFENGDESQVGAGYNYDQWHVGSVYNSGLDSSASLEFGECSVTTLAVPENAETDSTVTQVLKGYPANQRPTSIEDITALFTSMSIDIAQGGVTLQVPMFWHFVDEGDPDEGPYFSTFRNLELFMAPGVHSITLDTMTTDSTDEIEQTLAELFEEMQEEASDGVTFEVLGVGFTGSPGAEINSLSFGGDTYYFGTGDCTPEVPVDPADPADPVTPVAPKKPVAVETGF